jgi:hypothetical protein
VGRKTRSFLGRHIMLKKEYGELLLAGRKKATIRLGVVTPKYDELIVHSGGRPIAKVKITGVVVKRVGELTDSDAIIDGFRSRKELLESLRRAYGDVRQDDLVTIIKFDVIQKYDKILS